MGTRVRSTTCIGQHQPARVHFICAYRMECVRTEQKLCRRSAISTGFPELHARPDGVAGILTPRLTRHVHVGSTTVFLVFTHFWARSAPSEATKACGHSSGCSNTQEAPHARVGYTAPKRKPQALEEPHTNFGQSCQWSGKSKRAHVPRCHHSKSEGIELRGFKNRVHGYGGLNSYYNQFV